MNTNDTKWAFHMVVDDGADTFGFPTKAQANSARDEMWAMGGGVWVGPLIQMTPGAKHSVIYVEMPDGSVKNFGFGTFAEAYDFRRLVRERGFADSISSPKELEVHGDNPKLWSPRN